MRGLYPFHPDGVHAVHDHGREAVAAGSEDALFPFGQGAVHVGQGVFQCRHLLRILVETGQAQRGRRLHGRGHVADILHPAAVLAGDALIRADEELDTVDFLRCVFMPGHKDGGGAQIVPGGSGLLAGKPGRPVPAMPRIAGGKFFFDVFQGQIVDLPGGQSRDGAAQQRERKEKAFHASLLSGCRGRKVRAAGPRIGLLVQHGA